MNSLKPVLVLATLAGIGYAVYTRIHGEPGMPPGAPDQWTSPSVQLPGATSMAQVGGWGSPSGQQPAAPTFGGPTSPSAPVQPSAPASTSFNPPTAAIGALSAPAVAAPVTPALSPGGAAPATTFPGAAATSPAGAALSMNPPLPVGGAGLPGAPAAALGTNAPITGNSLEVGGGSSLDRQFGAPATMPPTTDARAAAAAAASGMTTFTADVEAARKQLEAGKLSDALRQLSLWYDDPRTSPLEQQQLVELLDQLAGTVIYSTQHHLEPAYQVQPGEQLEEVAARFHVSSALLAKMNGIEGPGSLRPGEFLKVVRGPFGAVINLERKQLTLTLSGNYAGRFLLGVGREYRIPEGSYTVVEKKLNPVYRGLQRTIDPDDPANPLGNRWLGLGGQYAIHGTNDPTSIGRDDLAGCVSLSPRDIDDLYDILSVGSQIVVRR